MRLPTRRTRLERSATRSIGTRLPNATPDRQSAYFRASCGVTVQQSDQSEFMKPLSGEEITAIRKKVAARFPSSSSSLTPLKRFMTWSISDRENRTVSPFSNLRTAEWLRNVISDGNDKQAYNVLTAKNSTPQEQDKPASRAFFGR